MSPRSRALAALVLATIAALQVVSAAREGSEVLPEARKAIDTGSGVADRTGGGGGVPGTDNSGGWSNCNIKDNYGISPGGVGPPPDGSLQC